MTEPSPYRYYLCIQDWALNWKCARVSEMEALHPFAYETPKPYTKAIPIHTWYPRIVDPILLHMSLHPKVGISM